MDDPTAAQGSSATLEDVKEVFQTCRTCRSPRSFVEALVAWLVERFGFDQAIALFYDPDGKIAAFHALRAREGWLESYLNYYCTFMDFDAVAQSAVMNIEELDGLPYLRICTIDWDRMADSLFKRRYIAPVSLRSTLTFAFCDLDDRHRVAICLDRMRHSNPDTDAVALLRETLPLLNSMYRNFFYRETDSAQELSPWKQYRLTAREQEVADLLCMGMQARKIAGKLFISQQTVHKHVAHIYRKVGVSSQAELIVRAANQRMLA